jgi:hypothetical protein
MDWILVAWTLLLREEVQKATNKELPAAPILESLRNESQSVSALTSAYPSEVVSAKPSCASELPYSTDPWRFVGVVCAICGGLIFVDLLLHVLLGANLAIARSLDWIYESHISGRGGAGPWVLVDIVLPSASVGYVLGKLLPHLSLTRRCAIYVIIGLLVALLELIHPQFIRHDLWWIPEPLDAKLWFVVFHTFFGAGVCAVFFQGAQSNGRHTGAN